MFDQSHNLNCCSWVVLLFQIYIYPKKSFESLLHFFLKFNAIVHRQNDYRDIKFGTVYLKNALVVDVAASALTGGLAFRLPATGAALDISSVIQFFVHEKSSSISW